MWLTGRSTVIQLRKSERKLGREKLGCFSLLSCQILKLRSSLCTIHLSQFGLYFTKVDYFLTLPTTTCLRCFLCATVHYTSPSPIHSPYLSIFQHLWVVLAAVVKEAVVVLAYFSCSKSFPLYRSTQPNQKENIQPQSEKYRKVQSKEAEVFLCSSVQCRHTSAWIFNKNLQIHAIKSADTWGKCRLAMASVIGNKLRQALKCN